MSRSTRLYIAFPAPHVVGMLYNFQYSRAVAPLSLCRVRVGIQGVSITKIVITHLHKNYYLVGT